MTSTEQSFGPAVKDIPKDLGGNPNVAVRRVGGFISGEVSRALAAMVQNASFFARQELQGWLRLVESQNLHIDTLDDVPRRLKYVLFHGVYEDSYHWEGSTADTDRTDTSDSVDDDGDGVSDVIDTKTED